MMELKGSKGCFGTAVIVVILLEHLPFKLSLSLSLCVVSTCLLFLSLFN